MKNTTIEIEASAIERAVALYPKRVTGAFAGCPHPGAVLRFALAHGGAVGRLARNYIATGHGACWNAMAGCLPANGWLRWYSGESASPI
jgi:hypothetical protein